MYESLINIDCVMLPPGEQKILLFMIHQAQHPASFSAGMISLNMVTFVNVRTVILLFGNVWI